MLVAGALNGGSEVCGPSIGLVVGCSIHQSFLTIATTEGVQGLISEWDSVLCVESILDTRYEFYFLRIKIKMFECNELRLALRLCVR